MGYIVRDRLSSGVMRKRDEFESDLRIRFLHGLNRVASRVYHRVEVTGEFRVPRAGPAIIISNHISSLDPLLIQSVVNRPIIWMVAKEYCELPGLRWIFESIHAIPVSRDGKDSSALRSAFRALDAGRVLGIFPEGKIGTEPGLLAFQTGVALIASRSGAPVVPVYQRGTTFGKSMLGAFFLPQSVTVRFGPAIHLQKLYGKTRDMDAPTRALEEAMAGLKSQAEAIRSWI